MKCLFLLPLLITQIAAAQFDSIAYRLAHTIEPGTLHDHVYTLASPEFEGRETGTEGNHKAALYIAKQFAADGIPYIPGDTNYFQAVNFTSLRWSDLKLTVKGDQAELNRDYLVLPYAFPLQPTSIRVTSLVFLGYGVHDPGYDDYKGMDVHGKNLLVFAGEPEDENGRYKITSTKDPSDWSTDINLKIKAAKDAGAASLWIVDDKLKDRVST
ncbi:MAG TPA: hypothetical protein VJ508_13130, partial [Saprospiraceae bacterium]|nr:hypothetical protein [Saprospiraceae bacterium]